MASAPLISAAAITAVMLRYAALAYAGPMHTFSSAMRTWRESRSASEWTATVARPASRHAAMIRRALSPRLAIRTLEIMRSGPDGEQPLPELDGLGVLGVPPHDRARGVGLDLVHELHGLHDAQHLALGDEVANLDVRIGPGPGRLVKRAHDRRGHERQSILVRLRCRGGRRDGPPPR